MSSFHSKFLQSAIFAAALLPVSASLSAQKVFADYDHKANFSRYHTFSIYKVAASNSIVEGRLRDDVTQSLTEKGWQAVPQGGDVAVTVIGKITNEQQYTSFYDGLGGGYGYGGWGGRYGFGGWRGGGLGGQTTTTVQHVPIGNLVIDLYDTGTHQLVFRGTSSQQISSNPDKNAKKGEKAVDKIFDKLPKGAS